MMAAEAGGLEGLSVASGGSVRRLNSPGPVSDAYLRSRAFVAGIIGPVGSGKSLTMLRKLLRVAKMQKGVWDERNGVLRRTARVGVIRDTYPNIDEHVLKSWFRIVPKEVGKFNQRAPYTHTFTATLAKDANDRAIDVLDLEVSFRAIGNATVEEACRGWEVNAAGADEFDLLSGDLVPFLSGRVGRFSDLDPSLVVDPQICLSLNMPLMNTHAYKLLMHKKLAEDLDEETRAALGDRPLIETFIQPGGMEPDAENLHNLPGATKEKPKGGRSYYLIQAALNKAKPGYVDRMIHVKPVPMQHGQPVNAGFKYSDHVRPLEWDRDRLLIVGMDQGLFAAAVAQQRTRMNQVRTLREAVNMHEDGLTLKKIGPTAFGQLVRAMLNEHFFDLHPAMVRFVCDPAGFAAGDRSDNEHDWILAVQLALGKGVRIHKAKSNSQPLRNQAIWDAMAERDGYAVDPACPHLIDGHLGGYRYQKAEMNDGEVKGHLEIQNTIYTHVCDADQYAALEGEHVIANLRHGSGAGRERRRIINDDQYSVLGD